MEIMEQKIVKARKEHTCIWCGKQIEKGEIHNWSKALQDGQFYEWRGCRSCEPYVEKAFKSYDAWGDGITIEDFEEFMKGEHREVAERWWGK